MSLHEASIGERKAVAGVGASDSACGAICERRPSVAGRPSGLQRHRVRALDRHLVGGAAAGVGLGQRHDVRAAGQAWNAEGRSRRSEEVEAAGQLLADAIGKLMLLIVMAVVARLGARRPIRHG